MEEGGGEQDGNDEVCCPYSSTRQFSSPREMTDNVRPDKGNKEKHTNILSLRSPRPSRHSCWGKILVTW